jgi:hypothetical protein
MLEDRRRIRGWEEQQRMEEQAETLIANDSSTLFRWLRPTPAAPPFHPLPPKWGEKCYYSDSNNALTPIPICINKLLLPHSQVSLSSPPISPSQLPAKPPLSATPPDHTHLLQPERRIPRRRGIQERRTLGRRGGEGGSPPELEVQQLVDAGELRRLHAPPPRSEAREQIRRRSARPPDPREGAEERPMRWGVVVSATPRHRRTVEDASRRQRRWQLGSPAPDLGATAAPTAVPEERSARRVRDRRRPGSSPSLLSGPRCASGRSREPTSLSIGDGDEGDCWSVAFLGNFPSLSFSHTGFLKVGTKGIAGVGLRLAWATIMVGLHREIKFDSLFAAHPLERIEMLMAR